MYQGTLGRAPDANGLFGWSQNLALGSSKLELAGQFVRSAEFQSKYGDTTDEEFIELLYINVLGRVPDITGFNGWVDALNNGWSREQVVVAFVDSAEFVFKTAPDVFSYMRGGDTGDMRDKLDGGGGDDVMIGGIGADQFKFIQGEGGSDLIGDFEAWDWVFFENFGYSDRASVVAHMTQQGDGVLFEDQGQSILFRGKEISDFTDDSFSFA